MSLTYLITLISLFFNTNQDIATVYSAELSLTNPFIAVAELQNSKGYSIDAFVKEKMEKEGLTEDEIFSALDDKKNWFITEFLMDKDYYSKLKMSFQTIQSSEFSSVDSEKYFEELELKFPYFSKLFPSILTVTMG